MSLIIGIDIGATTTKAVSIDNEKLVRKVKIEASDAVTAATGAFGKIVLENKIELDLIKEIKITGAGAAKIKNNIFGIKTSRINEITAIGTGGMFLSGMKNIIIANIGTGTAIIYANEDGIFHYGGSGVGGGTITGLAKKLLPTSEFNDVVKLAQTGCLDKVDLLLEDIMDTDISFLNKKTTVANFGKMSDNAACEDIAMAIINMVYQVIGMLSVFAARAKNLTSVIVTGNGSGNKLGQKILTDVITKMYGIEFIFPDNAEYTTAIGAGLSSVP